MRNPGSLLGLALALPALFLAAPSLVEATESEARAFMAWS